MPCYVRDHAMFGTMLCSGPCYNVRGHVMFGTERRVRGHVMFGLARSGLCARAHAVRGRSAASRGDALGGIATKALRLRGATGRLGARPPLGISSLGERKRRVRELS